MCTGYLWYDVRRLRKGEITRDRDKISVFYSWDRKRERERWVPGNCGMS